MKSDLEHLTVPKNGPESLSFRLVSTTAKATVVAPWGFDMEVSYEYDPGERAIFWPTTNAHPGSPPNVALLSCKVGGADITEMLSNDQQERIEERILEQLED